MHKKNIFCHDPFCLECHKPSLPAQPTPRLHLVTRDARDRVALLVALKELVKVVDQGRAAVDEARAAIALAEGETE